MSNSASASSRSRILSLLDDNSFVEIGSRVTARSTDFNIKANEAAGDGVITGYGTIDGYLCYVYSQDASVLGGSIGEMNAKKIVRMYDMAVKMGAPVIGILDCAGLRLQEATDALDGFGSIYLAESRASGVVPQICAVFGNCGGGLAVAASMADFVFMEKDAKLFVNSPNALAGSNEQELDNTTAEYQESESGIVDASGTEEEIFAKIRSLVNILPSNNEEGAPVDETGDDPNRQNSGLEQYLGDGAQLLTQISDGGFCLELGKNYGRHLVTAFIRMNGTTVGAVASNSVVSGERVDAVICPKAARKAADFINFCDAFDIPVLTLADVAGFARKAKAEAALAREIGRLTAAYASSDVPKVTVVTGKAFGSAAVALGSKSLGTDIAFAWPEAEIGLMDAKAAVQIMYADELEKAEKKAEFLNEKTEEYKKLTGSAEAAARRGYVDDIIEPAETRQRVIAAFEMLYTKSEDQPSRKHGTI
ncbi:acyl-CoA carboxylase subunit beta [Clostridium vitabionis]|uniref:acyl-CoA carboxylase subunit beta n=1 Tax=Clostridium vitabionis TaxID=2784388 RepID=UPI00188A66C2|nr:carboxyl transferase domain-containing protein [Clostridium vitabionis]